MKKLLLCIFLSSTAFMLQASVQRPRIVASVFLAPEYHATTEIEQILSARGIIFPESLKNFRAKGGDIGIGYDNTEKLFLMSRILQLSKEEPGTENEYNEEIITISDDKLTPTDTRSIIEIIREVLTSKQPSIIVASAPLAPEYHATTEIEQVLNARGVILPKAVNKIRADGGKFIINIDNYDRLWLTTKIRLFGMQEPGTETQIMYEIIDKRLNLSGLSQADIRYILRKIREVSTSNKK